MKRLLTNLISSIILFMGIYHMPIYGAENAANPDNSAHIYVSGCRALRDALKILGNQLYCVITYEDPQYTDETTHLIYPGAKLAVPYKKFLEFRYNSQTSKPKIEIIQAMVSKFNRENRFAEFAVRQSTIDKEIYHCIPVKFLNKGKLVPCRSLLEPITSVHKSGTYGECFEEIGRQNSNLILTTPTSTQFYYDKTTQDIDNKSASDCLDILMDSMLAKKFGRHYSWYLGRDMEIHKILIIEDVDDWKVNNDINRTALYIEAAEPLAVAAHILCQENKCSSLYEAPPVVNRHDVWYDKNDVPQSKAGYFIQYEYDRRQPIDEIFHNGMTAYNNHAYSGKFECSVKNNFVTIYPTQYMSRDDSIHIMTSHLSEIGITMPSKQSTLSYCIHELVKQIAAISGKKVEIGTIKELPLKKKVSCSAHSQPLSDYLKSLTDQIGSPICWQLLYDPRTDAYTLNGYPTDAWVTIK